MLWFFFLTVNAVGALGASDGSWVSLLFAFFGIGFGVAASLGLGIWICKLGPPHQFKLHADLWMKQLWWIHAPWLMIAPMTIVGSVIAIVFRFIDPGFGETVLTGVVLIELILWGVLSFACSVIWLDKYATGRRINGIIEANTVVRLHVLYAIAIWIGSTILGFFGGMLGSFFMMSLLGSDMMMDF
jgi:hypothetical protein